MSTRAVDDDEFKFVEVGPLPIKLLRVARVHWLAKSISHRLDEEAGGTYILSVHWLNAIAWRCGNVFVPAAASDVKLVHRRVDVGWVEVLLNQCLSSGMPSDKMHDWCDVIARISTWAGVLSQLHTPAPCVRLNVEEHLVEVPALRGARGSASLDLTLAAWAENITFSDFEAYIRRVFPVLECLWAAGSGRMVFTEREDKSGGFCMVCGTLLKQASAFASDPTLATDVADAPVQAMHVIIMLEARLPRAPLFVLPHPTKASCLQFMVALNMEAEVRFAHFFQAGWRRYSGFQRTLAAYGCTDGDALTYIVRWMSAFDSSAGLAEIPVAGLNEAVTKAVAGIGALSAPTVEQAVSEVARLLAHSKDKDSDKKVDTDVLHASGTYLALAKEMRLHDVQPIDGLAACTALISTTLGKVERVYTIPLYTSEGSGSAQALSTVYDLSASTQCKFNPPSSSALNGMLASHACGGSK